MTTNAAARVISARLVDISETITKGATPTTYGHEWQAAGVLFLRSECVSEHGLDLGQSTFISREANRAIRRSQVIDGDLLMTITGNVGRVVRLAGVGMANINQHIARIRIRDERFDRDFVYHYLSQKNVRRRYESITTGQAYPQLSLEQVRETVITTPDLTVQKAIAESLNSADSMIEVLECLIAKKEAIKQGVMQRLLMGQTRLPGFAGKWSEVRLGDIANIKTGSRNNQDKQTTGRYPFYVRSATVERIDTYSYDCEAILVPGEGGIGSIFHYIDGKFEMHQRVYKISHFTPNAIARFVYYYMKQFFGRYAMEHSVKATVDSLRRPTFAGFTITMPEDVNEQRAIASALDDCETEIERLQSRLIKTKAIKQGMMQELLTGRTRLSVPEGVST
jgi:type I restriction enzyme S subunit